ncbi:MAG: alpha-L-fucosidase [Treponema sp.]|nr:alpha-L-fucosidase [Treponema sp.]
MNCTSLVQVRPHERQIAWQELGFTAFFHFGINTFTNREWGTGQESPSLFNPSRLDTDQWCAALKSAGIRACILTAKHHDGFCLFDTAFTRHSVMSSPFPRDVAAMLAASCEKYGLKLGMYLSPWDRHEPCYGTGRQYDDFFCGQLEEILTRYGKLYSLWFDGACGEGSNGKKQFYDWDRYYALIRRHQPDAVISIVGPDVRWVGNEAGKTRSSEWSVLPRRMSSVHKIAADSQHIDDPAFRERPVREEDLGSREKLAGETDLIWYPAEVDVSIRPGWFYHPEEDDQVKPLETLLRFYETAAGGNAVLLLNIPPNREGRIHEADCMRLAELGAAIKNIFDDNLLEGASVCTGTENPSFPAANILCDDDSYWRPAEESEQAEITFTLSHRKKLTHLDIREQVRESQRIEAFSVHAKTSENNWEKIYSGTTVGFRKICRFAPVKTEELRITIERSRIYPTLRFAGAYSDPAERILPAANPH